MMKSREEIKAQGRTALKREVVPTEEWGDVIISELTAYDGDAFAMSLTRERPKLGGKPGELETYSDMTNHHAKLVARTVINEDGTRVFTDEDAEWLGNDVGAGLIRRLADVADSLSVVTPDAEAVVEGNSGAVPSDGSSSDSAPTSDSPAPDIS